MKGEIDDGTQDDREFGWGTAATGTMARTIAIIAAEPGTRAAAVGSRDATRARAFATEFGAPCAHGSYAVLLDDPVVDAVDIATPHAQRRHVAELAFAAGKAVRRWRLPCSAPSR
ncbi:Gfo/Idh/MocA family oxidoreductase [Yinghuangia sp. YIM S09857]|uniref:Gfo/Idh/MocA family oxidoreductase n=1 Tax=Yinghuangia sp. YIM S09857 TaxID=3436929 RepID=UPI003F5312E4